MTVRHTRHNVQTHPICHNKASWRLFRISGDSSLSSTTTLLHFLLFWYQQAIQHFNCIRGDSNLARTTTLMCPQDTSSASTASQLRTCIGDSEILGTILFSPTLSQCPLGKISHQSTDKSVSLKPSCLKPMGRYKPCQLVSQRLPLTLQRHCNWALNLSSEFML